MPKERHSKIKEKAGRKGTEAKAKAEEVSGFSPLSQTSQAQSAGKH